MVRGYKKSVVNLPSLDYVDNDDFEKTGEAATLAAARDHLTGDCILAYGDILFRHYVLDQLMATDGDIVLVADGLWRERDPDPQSRLRDLVSCSGPFKTGYLDENAVALTRIAPDLAESDIAKLSETGSELVRSELAEMKMDGSLESASMVELFTRLLDKGSKIKVIYITGHWLDIDNAADLADAQNFL